MLSCNIHGALNPQTFAMQAAFGDEIESLTPAAPVVLAPVTDAYAAQGHAWNMEPPAPYVGQYGRRSKTEETLDTLD